MSMPDKWSIRVRRVDLHSDDPFRSHLTSPRAARLLLRDVHDPNGQMPAYEFAFSDVNLRCMRGEAGAATN